MRAGWWWIDRWRKSTAYTDMTAEEQGVYRNLLDELWLRDRALPTSEKALSTISGDAEAWKRCRKTVLARFVKVDGVYRNETHDKVMAESKRRADKQRRYRERQRNRDGNVTGNGESNEVGNVDHSPSPSLVSTSQTPPPEKDKPSDDPAFAGIVSLLAGHEKWSSGIRKREEFARTLLSTYGEEWGGAGVLGELRKMAAWLAANPGKRYKQHRRFIVNWMNRAEPPDKPEASTYVPLKDRPKVAATPPGHPADGRKPGEWTDNGMVHVLTKSFIYFRKREDGTPVGDREQLPTRYA